MGNRNRNLSFLLVRSFNFFVVFRGNRSLLIFLGRKIDETVSARSSGSSFNHVRGLNIKLFKNFHETFIVDRKGQVRHKNSCFRLNFLFLYRFVRWSSIIKTLTYRGTTRRRIVVRSDVFWVSFSVTFCHGVTGRSSRVLGLTFGFWRSFSPGFPAGFWSTSGGTFLVVLDIGRCRRVVIVGRRIRNLTRGSGRRISNKFYFYGTI